jgi:hypothetical protein
MPPVPCGRGIRQRMTVCVVLPTTSASAERPPKRWMIELAGSHLIAGMYDIRTMTSTAMFENANGDCAGDVRKSNA